MRVRGVTIIICWFSWLRVFRVNFSVLCAIFNVLFLFYKEYVCGFLYCKGLKPTYLSFEQDMESMTTFCALEMLFEI
jgi:hypothetical protein